MSHLMNTVTPVPIKVTGAQDFFLHTSEGNLMDIFADTGTVNLGYNPPVLMDAIRKVPHHIPNSLVSDLREEAAMLLCQATRMDKVFFCNSGSEAVETAVKIIRKRTYMNGDADRLKYIYSEKGGFHGRTYAAMAAGDGPVYHTEGFGPHLPGIRHFSDVKEIVWDECAGILVTTINGNNDVLEYPEGTLEFLRIQTEGYDIPLVLDEVQCGMGRTGEFNAYDNYGILPDIVCLAKGVAAGIPTGACLARDEYAEVLTPGTHYSTFGGSPLSCVGINYAVNNVEALCSGSTSVRRMGAMLRHGLKKIPNISNVRGMGLWYAFDVENGMAIEFCRNLAKYGVYCVTFRKSVVKYIPMLHSGIQEIEHILSATSLAMEKTFGV